MKTARWWCRTRTNHPSRNRRELKQPAAIKPLRKDPPKRCQSERPNVLSRSRENESRIDGAARGHRESYQVWGIFRRWKPPTRRARPRVQSWTAFLELETPSND